MLHFVIQKGMISGVNCFIDSLSVARSCCHRYFENNDCNSIEIKEQKKIKAELHSLGKVSGILI